MARLRGDDRTLDLLAWEPPVHDAVVAYDRAEFKAATLAGRLCRAMTLAIEQSGKDRAGIAQEMSDYLGERVSVAMLNNYTSEAKTDHNITVARFAALIHATGDVRLITVLSDLFQVAIIPERYVGAVEDAMLADKIEELEAAQKAARRNWKGRSR